MSLIEPRLGSRSAWVDPASLPQYGDASTIAGNAPDYVKQLTSNTLGAYGVGDTESFAYSVGRGIRLAEVNLERRGDKWEATTVAEVTVSKGDTDIRGHERSTDPTSVCRRYAQWESYGARRLYVLHHRQVRCSFGQIDVWQWLTPHSCASFPLVALGVMQGTNGVGVSQALNVFFHSPDPLYVNVRSRALQAAQY